MQSPTKIAHAAVDGPVDEQGRPIDPGRSGLILLSMHVEGGRLDGLLSPIMAGLLREELGMLQGSLRGPANGSADEEIPEALAAALEIEGARGRAALVRRMIHHELKATAVIEALESWLDAPPSDERWLRLTAVMRHLEGYRALFKPEGS